MHREESTDSSHVAGQNSIYMVQDTYATYATMRPTEIFVQDSSVILTLQENGRRPHGTRWAAVLLADFKSVF